LLHVLVFLLRIPTSCFFCPTRRFPPTHVPGDSTHFFGVSDPPVIPPELEQKTLTLSALLHKIFGVTSRSFPCPCFLDQLPPLKHCGAGSPQRRVRAFAHCPLFLLLVVTLKTPFQWKQRMVFFPLTYSPGIFSSPIPDCQCFFLPLCATIHAPFFSAFFGADCPPCRPIWIHD